MTTPISKLRRDTELQRCEDCGLGLDLDHSGCNRPIAEITAALRLALALFEKDHAIDRFDWGKSALRAQDIRELNETPLAIRAALKKAEEL